MFCIYQLKIDREKNKALLDLNPFFYPPKAIEKAGKAFKKICSVKAKPRKNRLLVELRVAKKFDAEETALGFLNYALSIRREM